MSETSQSQDSLDSLRVGAEANAASDLPSYWHRDSEGNLWIGGGGWMPSSTATLSLGAVRVPVFNADEIGASVGRAIGQLMGGIFGGIFSNPVMLIIAGGVVFYLVKRR